MSPVRRQNKNKGCGLVNTLINKLPVELHLPGYQYCGPGTNLKKRLARGEKGINPLDAACREHDIAYDRSNSIEDRNKADYILENRAWERFRAKDAGYKEKAAAWAVTTGMKAKRKMGAGCGFKDAVKAAKNVLKKNVSETNICTLSRKCIAAAKKVFKKNGKKINKTPRVIPIPKSGGMLPLIPIFAGLSALGSLAGGATSVAKAIAEFNRTKPTHLGKGLYLTPHKDSKYKITGGEGMFLAPHTNSRGKGMFLAPHKNTRGEGLYLNPHKGRGTKKSANKKN